MKRTSKTLFSILLVCAILFSICSVPAMGYGIISGKVTDSLPETPEDFVPEVRIAILTDSHNNNKNVAAVIDKANTLYEDDTTYKGVDAIFHLGDFTSVGHENDYNAYIETVKAHEKEGTPVITLLGNHEMKRKDADEEFKSLFGYDPNGVYEINGFSFIAFSGVRSLTEWTFTPSSLKWASEQLEEAESKAGEKAVFVLQHPHNFGTVYGSTVWSDPQMNVILKGHNKVVSFSGHSHYPMNDPRSIFQSTYTSVGVGATNTFELDKNLIIGQHPDGYDTAAQFCIVEADSDGSVRILEYDLNSDTIFNEYYIDNVNDQSSYAYTYKNMKAHDSAPVFSEGTTASAAKNENGEWVLSFDEAKSNFIVHHYNITIKDEKGLIVKMGTFIDDYYVIDDDDTADFRIGTDTLESGKTYTASIVAVSAYHLHSDRIKLQFVAE